MLHTQFLRPIDIKFPVDMLEQDMRSYADSFRQWGEHYINYPRLGAPLVNLTGNLNDEEDPSCWPLDKWWKKYPDRMYWEEDFTVPTELLNVPSLKSLKPIKPFMIRSNVLKWNTTGHFKPHIDLTLDHISHIRLWGTNKPPLAYELLCEGERITNFVPGQMYLIDTTRIHSAWAHADETYTIFIALTLNAVPTITELLLD